MMSSEFRNLVGSAKKEASVCGWGILGCANIARKNCRSIEMSPNSRVCALASRQLSKAEKFRDQNRLPSDVTLYEGYESLLKDPDVNAVYIPLPTVLHLEWVLKAAAAGKHVLVEKPVAMNAEQFHSMAAACREAGVLLMDGVMFMHHDRLPALNSLLKDPRCGQVARVDASFCFNGGEEFLAGGDIRTRAEGDPLGALGDLGWYTVRLGQVAFSRGLGDCAAVPEGMLAQPSHCIATCDNWTPDGVPLDCDAKVYFHLPESTGRRHGVLAFNTSFLLPLRQSFAISIASDIEGVGDQVISCDDFVLPRSPYSSALHVEIGAALVDNMHRVVALQDDVALGPCVQEANMFTSFSSVAMTGDQNQMFTWSKISYQTQLIVNACFDSMRRGGERVDVPVPQEHVFS